MSFIKFKSIRQKITVWCGLFLVLTVTLIVGYSASSMRSTAIQNAKSQALTTAREQAAAITGQLEEAINTARTLSKTLSAVKNEHVQLDITREAVNGILQIVLAENPGFLGVYTCWEPDRFDELDVGFADTEGHDSTGRFIPYWSRGAAGTLSLEPLQDYENDSPDDLGNRPGDYYLIPRETQREAVINPYLYPVQGKETLITSLVVPVMTDGTFHAIAGVDLTLDNLQKQADNIDIYDQSAQIFVISHKGLLAAASGQPDKVGQSLDACFDDGANILSAVQSATESATFVGDWLRVVVPMSVGQTGTDWGVIIRIPRSNVVAAATGLMWKQIGLGVVCVAITLVLLWVVANSITQPIRETTDILKDIAHGEGDLTRRIQINSSDEIGELGTWFNTFIKKIHDVIVDVGGVTGNVAAASTQIAASSEHLAQGMNNQNNQVMQISSAIEEMSASIVEVARKSTDAASNASESGKVAQEGGQVVAETVNDMQSISQAVSLGAASVTELGKRSQQIGQIIEVINDIADQTNLLALNAAIEAARAGEHGRGFAVVADEVRKLADRTTKATDEIAQSINAIQTETQQAVKGMQVGTQQVESGVQRARQAGSSLEHIVAGAQEVAVLIQSIAAAAEEQSSASEQVARNVEAVSEVTSQATDSANQAAQAAVQLSTQAEHLQRLVRTFKVDAQTS